MSKQVEAKNQKKIIIALGVVIVVLLAVVIGILVMNSKGEKKRDLLIIDEDNVAKSVEQLKNKEFTENPSYTVEMNQDWIFVDGVAEDAYVANSKDNTNSVYFDIYLAGNEETAIYESPIMPVGSHLENIALKEDLDPGTYDCVVKYNLVDEDGNDLSYVRVSLSIVVMD